MRSDITPAQVKTALLVAGAADLLQIVLLPAAFTAAAPLATNVIDVVVALVLVRLLGWHWAFLPTLLAELVPFLDLVPTWTAAVFLVTRGAVAAEPAEVVVDTTARPVGDSRPLPPGAAQPRRDSSGS